MRPTRGTPLLVALLVLCLVWPGCRSVAPNSQHRSLNSEFRRAVQGSDRLRARSGGEPRVGGPSFETLFVVHGQEGVAAVTDRIRFDEQRSGTLGYCCCPGDPTLEYYRGTERAATLSMHHGTDLVWFECKGCDGNLFLTPSSAVLLAQWLADNGVPGPLSELLESGKVPPPSR